MSKLVKFSLVLLAAACAACFAGTAKKGENEMEKRELKDKLTPLQYQVTQECGTEPPFANAYWNNKEAGIYVDIVSGEPLFSSQTKFDSGTGWPSFFAPLVKDNLVLKEDTSYGMQRTEVRSNEGDSHLGHLFNDGPDPTGLRYCINSASLRFIPAARLAAEGYGTYASLFGVGTESAPRTETAVLGGGCFWCLEAVFERIPGVEEVISGYAGGTVVDPTYDEVCTGKTGHAEVVSVRFDPAVLPYGELLEIFFKAHDPTTLNRQGADTGTQYRSVILYTDDEQRKTAEEVIKKIGDRFTQPVVTEVKALPVFYPAEDYHQNYYDENPENAYCRIVIDPKLEKLGLGVK